MLTDNTNNTFQSLFANAATPNAPTSATTTATKQNQNRRRRNDICGVYFAPSTIPGAGMGMFAGHDTYHPGDIVTESDLVIPTLELEWHNDHDDFPFLWDEYSWAASMFAGMDQEVENSQFVHGCSGGMGAAVNCRLNLVNTEDIDDALTMGMSGVSSQSPGAGAFTPYYGRSFHATKIIPAGMELYASYGENYFSSRSGYEMVPLYEDYPMADNLIKQFRFLQRTNKALVQNDNLVTALWDLIHALPYKSRTMYALPTTLSQVDHVMATGGTKNQYYNESIRDLDWLQKYGRCMDNMKDGISTIPSAGRGAFANRFIPKGSVVAPAPLIHIGDRNFLTMYEALPENEKGKIHRDPSRPYHYQLLLNYCFGHRESSLLLCPYGHQTALINHSKERVNAKIVWSPFQRHPEWLNASHHYWYETRHAGLTFEFVALRDIEEDEEIFLDYGDEWEAAWQNHEANFDPPRRDYMPAFEMNNQIDLHIKTLDEIDYEGTEGILTFCRNSLVLAALGYRNNEELNVVNEEEEEDAEPYYRCRVRFRNHDNSYIAELVHRETVTHESGGWDIHYDFVKYVLFDVPRDIFYFRDAPYTRDHYQFWSFRHDMRIPDDIFPDAWRDLRSRM